MTPYCSGFPITRHDVVVIALLVAVNCCYTAVCAQQNLIFLPRQDMNVYLNYNRNNGVGGPYEKMFYPTNNIEDLAEQQQDLLETQDVDMSGLQGLKDIVKQAAGDGKRVRAFGARWSSNNIPYTEDYLIDTSGLQYAKIGIDDPAYLMEDYLDRQEILTFVQGGVMTKYMYKALFKKGLTLSTSGLSDGQTMAGGISTATHNSAVNYGSMQEYVLGIHLVLKDETVFLQKASKPAVTDLYTAAIGADRIVNDDDIFYAALVGLGSFGLIHGFLIEPEPLFRLNVEKKNFPYDQVRDALFTVDAKSLGFDIKKDTFTPLHHFEAYINPYRLDEENGCQVRVMQKTPLSDDELVTTTSTEYKIKYFATDPQRGISEMLSSGYQTLLSSVLSARRRNKIGRYIYGMLDQILIEMVMRIGGTEDGYPLEIYGDEGVGDYYVAPGMKAISMEIAVPLSQLKLALPIVLQVLHDSPAFVMIDLRYVQGTRATLGFAKHNGINALIDLPSADIPSTRVAFDKIQQAMEDNRDSIDFTFHIGKYMLKGNEDWVHKSYGEAAADWMVQRERLLTTAEERDMFANRFLEDYGLAS